MLIVMGGIWDTDIIVRKRYTIVYERVYTKHGKWTPFIKVKIHKRDFAPVDPPVAPRNTERG